MISGQDLKGSTFQCPSTQDSAQRALLPPACEGPTQPGISGRTRSAYAAHTRGRRASSFNQRFLGGLACAGTGFCGPKGTFSSSSSGPSDSQSEPGSPVTSPAATAPNP